MEGRIMVVHYTASFANHTTRFPNTVEDIADRLQLVIDLGKISGRKQDALP